MKATRSSEIFLDDRGPDRVMRVSWHPEHQMAVLSVWRGEECVSTFRLAAKDVPAFVYTLNNGLAELATATSTRRDEVAADLLRQRTATPPQQPTDTWSQLATRALDMLADASTRLRDRFNRR